MKVFILVEPDYRDTFWCLQTLNGIGDEAGRKRYELHFVDGGSPAGVDWEGTYGDARKMIILIGTSVSWIPRTLELLSTKGIHVILVSYQPPPTAAGVSCVLMDHADTTAQLLRYFLALGRKRIALFGINPNSSADMLKRECFLSIMGGNGDADAKRHVFLNFASMDHCYAHFDRNKGRYDAVLCANDVVAVSMIRRLSRAGTRVPEDLFVASFGGTLLSRLFRPSLTTATLNHEELGRQAVSVFAYMLRNPDVTSSSVKVACRTHIRESTGSSRPAGGADPGWHAHAAPRVVFYADPEVTEILGIEKFLTRCDELDLRIIDGLEKSVPYEKLAEDLSKSENTVKYRIKRMLSWVGRETRDDLLALLRTYLPEDAIGKAMAIKAGGLEEKDLPYP